MIGLPGSILTLGLGGSPSLMITLGYGLGSGGAVFPAPGQVLSGVVYGPNGNDYTGTLTAGGGAVFLRRR